MSAKDKTHPEDLQLAEQIKRATSWSAFLLHGPHDRRKVLIETPGREGYEAALAAAEQLNAGSQFGRRAIVYAINSLGSFPVDPKLAKLAGLVA